MTIPEIIIVLQAAERGEEIEKHKRGSSGDWLNVWEPKVHTFDFASWDYRVKPKPRMVPLGPEDVDLHRDLFCHNGFWFFQVGEQLHLHRL